jgi:iron complex outermembrane recepter protein
MGLQGKGRSYMIEILLLALAAAVPIPIFAAEMHQFDVPAEDASLAIRDFASQARVQILVAGENVPQKNLHALSGAYSTDQGLRLLLADSGLSPKYVGDRSIALIMSSQASTTPSPQEATKNASDRVRLAQASPGGYANHPSVVGNSSPSAPATAEGASQLQEVVVTAQKRTERLRDVPEAVTVLDAEALLRDHQVSLEDYSRSVPGLTFYDNGNGFKELVIRGITAGQADTPTVGVYIDDTPIGSSTALARGDLMVPDLDPSDLQRVEVLKGPQGTLYGSSNMGGLLKYVTVLPDTHEYSGRVGVDGETVDRGGSGYAVRGAVNIPLVQDQLALRISASEREDPGYIENVTDGHKDFNNARVYNGRAALLWLPSDDLSVKFNAMFQERRAYGLGREDFNLSTNQPIEGDLKVIQAPGTDHDKEELDVFNVTIDDNLGWAKLTSSSSFAKSSYVGGQDLSSLFNKLFGGIFGIPNFGDALTQSFGTDKFTQEIRLDGHWGSRIDWLTGAFYTHESSKDFQEHVPVYDDSGLRIASLPVLYDNSGTSIYQEFAGFGDLTYHFTAAFDAQAGVRVSYNKQSFEYIANNSAIFGGPSAGHGTSNQTVPTFLFTPRYKLSDDLMVYGRIASGYRAGGPNSSLPGTEPPYKSDTTINYEVGVKQELLNHTAYIEAAAFYIDWHDVQLLGLNALNESFFTNAASAVSEGLEFSGQYNIVRGLSVAANFTYADAHLTANAPPGVYAPPGTQLPYSPKWSGQASATYMVPLVGDWIGRAGVDYSYVGSRFSGTALPSRAPPPGRPELPAYQVGNVHAGVDNGKYSADLWIHNLSNERGLLAANAGTLGKQLNAYVATIIPPRTLGISLAVKF